MAIMNGLFGKTYLFSEGDFKSIFYKGEMPDFSAVEMALEALINRDGLTESDLAESDLMIDGDKVVLVHGWIEHKL